MTLSQHAKKRFQQRGISPNLILVLEALGMEICQKGNSYMLQLDKKTLCFPVEPAFNVALQAGFTMFEEAFTKHIVIVTPTTLLATLKTVSSIWTIERQNKKAAEFAERAGLVYDKLRVFLVKMDKLGGQLNTAQVTFDDAMKTLRNGNGNLVRQAEQFKEQGVRVKNDIPENILAKSDIADSLVIASEAE
ncbi:DNA recombination protein RmuC [Alteromonas sp. C1M14]|uniref:DNA recombination protein RmuC n=1 Tax=Alteromonas sp. C1M14 TaxID=2841567 RepID=UPI001C09008B|nr:DNA recombination protein RmuC [Alteromonas sp. C1M14]MBU2979711.1 DNA recombination protein RmuC [Alteromonas sp. C1M14]